MEDQKDNTVEESSRREYDQFSPAEKQILKAKFLYAVDHDDTAVMYFLAIIKGADAKGLYDNVKFDANVEVIGDVTLS